MGLVIESQGTIGTVVGIAEPDGKCSPVGRYKPLPHWELESQGMMCNIAAARSTMGPRVPREPLSMLQGMMGNVVTGVHRGSRQGILPPSSRESDPHAHAHPGQGLAWGQNTPMPPDKKFPGLGSSSPLVATRGQGPGMAVAFVGPANKGQNNPPMPASPGKSQLFLLLYRLQNLARFPPGKVPSKARWIPARNPHVSPGNGDSRSHLPSLRPHFCALFFGGKLHGHT